MKTNLYFHHAMHKIITVAFAGLFGIYSLVAGVRDVKTEKAEAFQPVLRFAVCSDAHLSREESGLKNAEKFKKMFSVAYGIAKKSDYKGLDAVLVAGDMTESGKTVEYEFYRELTDKYVKDGTELLTVMGNHEHIEYRDTSNPQKAIEVFNKYVSDEEDFHKVIGGYHFIGVSYDDNGKEEFKTKLEWLRAELDKAVADTGDKPIFVMQHPHPALTVYGSVNLANI